MSRFFFLFFVALFFCTTKGYSQVIPGTDKLNSSKLHFRPSFPINQNLKKLISKSNTVSSSDTLNSKHKFFIRNLFDQTKWNQKNFILLRQSKNVNIWVDTLSSNQLLSADQAKQVLDSLLFFLTVSTPSKSIDSAKGIIEIEHQFFSDPTDVDGNERVDILLTNIQDNFLQTGGYVAGFFDPVNQLDYEFSNKREIVYIDIFPTLFYENKLNIRQGAQTIAHEYQHLLHFQYMTVENQEWVSINEGCSEFAEYFTGFIPRPIVDFPNRTFQTWYYWDVQDIELNYERSALFITFLYEKYGINLIGNIIHNKLTGIKGIESSFEELNLPFDYKLIMTDWAISLLSHSNNQLKEFDVFNSEWQKSILANPIQFVFTTPESFQFGLESSSFSYTEISLLSDFRIYENRNDGILYSIAVENPNAQNIVYENINFPFTLTFDNLNTKAYLVAINPDYFEDEQVKNVKKSEVEITGTVNGFISEIKDDDGIPDPFRGSARFLKLPDSTYHMVTLFNSTNDKFKGVFGFSIYSGFLSEFEGTGINSAENREFQVSFFSNHNNYPQTKIGNSVHYTSKRAFAQINFEDFIIPSDHPVSKFETDSLWLEISNVENSANPIAFAMNNSNKNRSGLLNYEGELKYFNDIYDASYHLENFNPMVRLNVYQKMKKNLYENNFDFSFEHDSLMLNNPSFISSVGSNYKIKVWNESYSNSVEGVIDSSFENLMVLLNKTGMFNVNLEIINPNSNERVHSSAILFLFPKQNSIISRKINNSPFIDFISTNSIDTTLFEKWGWFLRDKKNDGFEIIPLTKTKRKVQISIKTQPDYFLKFESSHPFLYGNNQYKILWGLDDTIKIKYSNEFASSQSKSENDVILQNIYPNPFNSSTKLFFDSKIQETAEIVLFNVLGQVVGLKKIDLNVGKQIVEVDFSELNLSSGVYLINLQLNGKVIGNNRKVIYLK